ncbi:MAG: right-handed parallel beta-helix repeat-containing protein [Thermoproteota archaeon]
MRSGFVLWLVVSLVLACVPQFNVVEAESGGRVVVPDDYGSVFDAVDAAEEGDTVFVRSGVYYGPVNRTLVLDKSISLIGEDAEKTIIKLYPSYVKEIIFTQTFYYYSDAITFHANDVKISYLSIVVNPGGDINVIGDRAQIIGNNITSGLSVQGSQSNITRNTMGKSIHLKGSDSSIVQNSVLSIMLDASDSNTIANNICKGLTVGLPNRSSSYNIISENKIEGPGWGIWIGEGYHNVFHANYIANFSGYGPQSYGVGGVYGWMENNTFYKNSFLNNRKHVDFRGDIVRTDNRWDYGEQGNYWDDYNGIDANGDGVGDTPYVIDEYNQDNYPLMSPTEPSGLLDIEPPAPLIISPTNQTYHTNYISLNFTVDELVSWAGYSLDDQENVTVTGSSTLLEMPEGSHKLVVRKGYCQ